MNSMMAQMAERRRRMAEKAKETEKSKPEPKPEPETQKAPEVKAPEPKAEEIKKWSCSICSYENQDYLSSCSVCLTMRELKPGEEPKPEETPKTTDKPVDDLAGYFASVQPSTTKGNLDLKDYGEDENEKSETPLPQPQDEWQEETVSQQWQRPSVEDGVAHELKNQFFAEQQNEDEYERVHGVRRPIAAQIANLMYDDDGNDDWGNASDSESDIEQPLARELNGDLDNIVQFYKNNASTTSKETREMLSKSFRDILEKQKRRYRKQLTVQELELVQNCELDTNLPNTLIFTLGYTTSKIKALVEPYFAKIKNNVDEHDNISSLIGEFAECSCKFRLLKQTQKCKGLSFFDDVDFNIANETITQRSLNDEVFMKTIMRKNPLLILIYPMQNVLNCIFNVARWNYPDNNIFSYEYNLPEPVKDIISVDRFMLCSRKIIREICFDQEISFPIKKKKLTDFMVEVISQLESLKFPLIPYGGSVFKRYIRETVVKHAFKKDMSSEIELLNNLNNIRKKPGWVSKVVQIGLKNT
eukprot:UN33108